LGEGNGARVCAAVEACCAVADVVVDPDPDCSVA